MRTVLALLLAALPVGRPAPDERCEAARTSLLARAVELVPAGRLDPSGPGSRGAFLSVLSTSLFQHRELGPFDLYVRAADGLARPAAAERVLDRAAQGLQPLLPLLERHFSGDGGLVAGTRFPIVLAEADVGAGQSSFDELLALLDWAEDDYSGWKAAGNPVWSELARDELSVRTWEVQLFNLAHPTALAQGPAFLEHGLGYYSLGHVGALLLRRGAWGLVPPWLAQGLIDELDIEAYGEAWVGGDWWEKQTPGWYRPGWSGFVPQGASPPPPVTGPPADLAVTVTHSGDSWQHRAQSKERHWSALAADRKSEAPASFRFMAEHESFLPRDRALARCALHVLLHLAPPDRRPGLLRLLDRPPRTLSNGMSDAEPLPVLVDRALGGLPEIAELEALPLEEMLARVGRPDLAARIRELGGAPALELPDHRDQAEWLFAIPEEDLDLVIREALFACFLEAEYVQQLREWALVGAALDRGMAAALEATAGYPSRDATRQHVAQAFWRALGVAP